MWAAPADRADGSRADERRWVFGGKRTSECVFRCFSCEMLLSARSAHAYMRPTCGGNEARLNARERPRQAHRGGIQMAAKRMTKSQIVGEISEKTGLAKREVSAVFEGL